jgi:hypothetical protein
MLKWLIPGAVVVALLRAAVYAAMQQTQRTLPGRMFEPEKKKPRPAGARRGERVTGGLVVRMGGPITQDARR